MVCSTIVFSDHAISQMFKRDILVEDVKQVISKGEVIKEYPNDNGVTNAGFVTVTLEKKGTIVLIKNVPGEVCTNCGHYFLSEEMTKEVLKKGNDASSKGAELEIVNLKFA